MKKYADQLIKEIDECKGLSPDVKRELIEMIILADSMRSHIGSSRTVFFTTRFISAGELSVEQPEELAALLGYKPGVRTAFTFDDFFGGIHRDDIADFSIMMDKFRQGECSSYSGMFRMMNCSGDYIWLFSRAWVRGTDEMTGKPLITGIMTEICDGFRTQKQFETLNRELLLLQNTKYTCNFSITDIRIVKLMTDGLTIDRIAETLNISQSNLNYRKKLMFAITNTGNAPALINYFISHGLV